MAIGQLKIDTDIVRLVTTAGLAGMALALRLSFGLGSRDVTRNVTDGFYARTTFLIGEEMEVLCERGTLSSITPTQTILERDGHRIAAARSVLLLERRAVIIARRTAHHRAADR
jgi:hypothetical protein